MIHVRDIQKKLEKVNIDTANTNTFGPEQKRTPSYQKFFQGWTVKEYPAPNGKIRKKRIYIGQLFIQDLMPGELLKKKIMSVLLTVIGLIFFIFSVFRSNNAGSVWYVYIPQACSLLGFAILIWYTGYQLFLPEKLTVSDYRSNAKGFMLAALAQTIILMITAVLTLLYILLQRGTADHVISILLLIVSSLLSAVVFYMEFNTSYIEVPNENAPGPYD